MSARWTQRSDRFFFGWPIGNFSSALLYEHAIAIREETIALFHRMTIGGQHLFFSSERAHQHQQCRPGQMEISQQRVHNLEAKSRIDEDIGVAAVCPHFS